MLFVYREVRELALETNFSSLQMQMSEMHSKLYGASPSAAVVRFSGRVPDFCALLLPFWPCRDPGTTTLDACILLI